jgi:hypothetical protein
VDPVDPDSDPEHCGHDTLLFSVAQGIFRLSTERLSRRTLHLKEVRGGVCTLELCSLSTVTSCIDASVRIVTKIPVGGTSTYILHLSD